MMAEVIGVVSGVLTISKAVRMALEVVSALYKAPEEIASLQHELERFTLLVYEIQGTPQLSSSILNHELLRSWRTITRLQQFINEELLKGGVPSRRAWAMKTQKIVKFHDELEKEMTQLTLVLVAFNSISTLKVAQGVNMIAGGVTDLRRSINSISYTLQDAQDFPYKSIPTNQATKQTTEISNGLKYSAAPEPDARQPRWPEQSCPARPATSFELSSSFYPEQYTNPSSIKQLHLYYMIEKSRSDVERVDEYHLWYTERPRKWQNIIVELTTKRTSALWSICQSPRSGSSSIAVPFFPKPLQRQIENRICDLVQCDNAHLSFEIDDETKNAEKATPEAFCLQIGFHENQTRQLFDFVRDLGCPIFCESDIMSRRFLSANMFVGSTADGNIHMEHKICPSYSQIEDAFQQIKLLHCLRSSPHVIDLVGVVVDDSFSTVKSYLTVPPLMKLGPMIGVLGDGRQSCLPLPTRLLWAQQIVAGVRDIHERGFVVGLTASTDTRAFQVDHQGNIRLSTFRSSMRPEGCYMHGEATGDIAPEQRLTDDGDIKFTSRTDLFQLGKVLWLLVHCCDVDAVALLCTCFPAINSRPMCRPKSIDPYVNPVTKPLFEESIPTWYSRMIEICRSPRPENRLPASALLAMFPRPLSLETAKIMLPAEVEKAAKVKTTKVPRNSACNRCFILCTGSHYHCNLCVGGNYDICQSCVASGLHCEDDDHFLGIRKWNGYHYESIEQYHSKVIINEEKKDNILSFK